MDFKEIQYVLAIEQQQTLSAAARAMRITQPSVSKFLQNLEKRLQVSLFERIDNKLIPTLAGQQYIATGLKILDLNLQLANNLTDISNGAKGRISVGITPTRGRYVLPNVLPQLKKTYPHYAINILEEGVNELNQALSTGIIDLAIYTVKNGYREEFLYEHICREEIVLAISPNNPLASTVHHQAGRKHPWIDINQMQDTLFFMVDGKFRTRKIADKIIAASSICPEYISLQSVESVLSIVAAGIGVGFCTDLCERFFCAPNPLLFCSVGEGDNEWDFVIAWRKNSYLAEAARLFIQMTKQQFMMTGTGDHMPINH